MADMDYEEAVTRQVAFDEALDRIRDEGGQAYLDGLAREDNPYADHPEPHFRNAWRGGWAEACLGIWDGPKTTEQRDEEARAYLLSIPR
jgi:ribosome modulation factor